MTLYVIGIHHYTKRAHATEGGESIVEWVADLRYGVFDRNVDAKREWLYQNEVLPRKDGGHTDDFIKLHFHAYSVNMGHVKVLKLKDKSLIEELEKDHGSNSRTD